MFKWSASYYTAVYFIFIAFASQSYGQRQNVRVFSESRFEYKYPWAGGMNSCQFGKIDMDLDGVNDLVVFDRVGDRILPFLVISSGNNFDYKYAPEYVRNFPVLSQWAIFEDYNLDGKTDIFTYSPGYAGLKVYKNTSDNVLEFRLEVFPYLKSYQGGGYVNILVTYADYPAITDLDGDGDLDILTFYGLGSFVEKHRNLSMEKYGHADSLDFEKTESCWGYFAEGIESNSINLDTCLRCKEAWRHGGLEAWKPGPPTADRQPLTANRHTGSTFRILDLNADDLPDLLLGDVDYPNLVALFNGGTPDTARMTSYEWEYPSGDQPINLFSMPAAYYDDFDFDGIKDLLVSPFDPNPFLPENFRSNWLYHNSGTDDQPQLSLQTRSFLQKDMLDFGAAAYPIIFDIDNDGLKDLIVGNYGYYDTSFYDEYHILHTIQTGQLAFLKNTGTASQPAFTLIDRDLAGISGQALTGIVPALSDLDGDGDPDLVTGCEPGTLMLFQNNGNQDDKPLFDLVDVHFANIDVGSYSAPQFFDLDKDGLSDLIIGEKGGNLNYYKNTGSLANPEFTLISDSLGKINVTDFNVSLDGYSVPCFYRDQSGNTHLLVGSEQGKTYYYTGIDGNLNGKFVLSDTLSGLIGVNDFDADFGYRSAPSLADLDQDGYPDLITGNFSGGLNFSGKNAQVPINQIPNNQYPNTHCNEYQIYPNPARDIIYIKCKNRINDGPVDISLYDCTGKMRYSKSFPAGEQYSIPAGSFPRGVCILKINNGEMSYFFRVALN